MRLNPPTAPWLAPLVLAPLLLAGCALQGATPIEPAYLDSTPTRIHRRDIYRYACDTRHPVICSCSGRLADCDCRCPYPRSAY